MFRDQFLAQTRQPCFQAPLFELREADPINAAGAPALARASP
jgi:hypothetical protein